MERPFDPAKALCLAVLSLVLAALLLIGMANAARAQTVGPPLSPGLTAGVPDNCEGSASGGVATGLFGLSFGFTSTREDCNRRADARVLAAIGDREAAEERLCESPKVREARALVGRPCRRDGPPPSAAPAAPPPPRAGELTVKPIDVCGTLSSPAERRAYRKVCG